MSFLDELDELADEVKDDVQELRNRAVKLLEAHAREHPDRLFKLLRTVKPVLLRHNLAIVTRYHDVEEVLTHDEAFSVQPYREKMVRLAGDFILGTDDSPRYERDVSILRLAAPRSDVPALAGFVEETAEALVAERRRADRRRRPLQARAGAPVRPLVRDRRARRGHADRVDARDLRGDLRQREERPGDRGRGRDVASKALAAHLDEAIAARKAQANGAPPADVVGRLLAMQGTSATAFSRRGDPRQRDRARVRLRPHDRDRHHVRARRAARAARGARRRPGGGAGGRRRRSCARTCSRGCGWRPQGPGLFRRTRTDFEVAEGSMHATKIPAGTLTFAATQSAMLDDDVVDDPDDFRIGRPAHHYLHFGVGLHQCFGRFANAMQIPLIAKAVLRRPGLARAPGPEGQLVKDGPFPQSLVLTFEGS